MVAQCAAWVTAGGVRGPWTSAGVGAANLSLLGFQVAARAVRLSGTLDGADPFVGYGMGRNIVPGDELQLRDVGGFRVGSRFSWRAFARYGHEFNICGVPVQGLIGDRRFSVDSSQGAGFSEQTSHSCAAWPIGRHDIQVLTKRTVLLRGSASALSRRQAPRPMARARRHFLCGSRDLPI